MLKDVEWSEDGTYTPQGVHKPLEFFSNALRNSVLFDIQLGYFNSAAIHILASSFATFIKNGGYMRMAINHIVSSNDKMAIELGESSAIDTPIDLTDWNAIKSSLDEYGEQFFRCLAFLIQEKRIELRIIKPKSSHGIAHTKCGQFSDGETVVSFTGSANFTLSGLLSNKEEIVVLLNTSPDPFVRKRIESQKKAFTAIMSHNDENVEYLSAKDLEEAVVKDYGGNELEELLNVEEKLRHYEKHIQDRERGRVSDMWNICYDKPKFPYSSGPRDYQKTAFENWKNNGQKGLFAMATGTGKTITALNCLLEIYKRCGYYKAIILVPTITLVNQWEAECRKFNFNRIVKVCSKNKDWKEEIGRLSFSEKYLVNTEEPFSFVIISTYASFAKENIFIKLNEFDRKKVLLIADEAHNMGSPMILKRLKQCIYLRRIGLSATPERQYDDDANRRIFSFFGAEDRYTYEYSMEEAIEKGVLCRYYYYPHLVRLTDEEMEKYVELSLKIAKYFNYNSGTFDKKDEVLTGLLLARKRIIHKACNKLGVFTEILNERFHEKGNLKYTLVYVPEGNRPDYIEDSDIFDKGEQLEDDEVCEHIIDIYTEAVMRVNRRVTVRKFTSGQKNREEILSDFASGELQVLTSMKCLDEGVDVPRSEMAIFCASTGNPRQFIQRRGRVLRTHKAKEVAFLHDLVVVPEVSISCDSFKMEQSLLKSELLRVKNFALLSENPSCAEMELQDVMNHYSLNLYNNEHIL